MEKYTGIFDTREEFLEHQTEVLWSQLETCKKYKKDWVERYTKLVEDARKQWYDQPHISGCEKCDRKDDREFDGMVEDQRLCFKKCDGCSQHHTTIKYVLDE
jgi:hypothetical protein